MSKGKGDRLERMQMSVMPDINKTLKGFQLEMLFEYPNELEGVHISIGPMGLSKK